MKAWENDSCATVQACFSVYPVAVAAALWCGVSPDEVDEELRRAIPVGQGNALARATLRHPYLKCLEPRIRAIHAAIDGGELLSCREDGRPVNGEHVAYERRHVYGQHLKEWAKSIAPSERPAFLFDDVERGIHSAITQEAYQALKAAHDGKEQKLIRANERIRELGEEKARIEAECNSLKGMVDRMSAQLKSAPPGERSETTYLNIIAGLVRLLTPSHVQDLAGARYESQAAVIQALLSAFPSTPGISQRTLEERFAAANRSIDAS
ncbi:hypothetical protein ACFQ3P_30245 [Paraburkholderia sabiae]|uniref:Protein kinase n=1 Tax=Paraburkholderia sabiae TaxID=273251 RepID=A0ABU9QN46_9BURK|nr:hypothetical protein [Paraburkholderia sabiae]WJZ74918.1 hypothetical protein QEN71_03625 [Paraburkholderia sabiae]CAD6551466.1 hypothetical protein LMG24235_04937 [Paraburkholderia sabiae]